MSLQVQKTKFQIIFNFIVLDIILSKISVKKEQMNESRNLLYEIKKKSDARSSPFYNPVANQGEMDLRDELRQLRQINRSQETQIIRLKEQINQMRAKILFYQSQLLSQEHQDQHQSTTLTKQLTSIPIVLQTKDLKIQLQHIHQVNLQINGKNRQLQQKNRQLESELSKSTKKIKEIEILYQVRIQNAERELEEARNRVLEQDSHECRQEELKLLTQATKKIIIFIRQQILSVSYGLFVSSANQCEKQKKTNSYKIFVKQWSELTKQKHLGYMALVQSLKSLQQIESLIKYDKNEIFDLNRSNQPYRDTLNEWIINTLTEIRYPKKNEKLAQQKLFRLLGLYYRSNFPIQGQLYKLDEDVKNYFSQTVCEEIYSLIITG